MNDKEFRTQLFTILENSKLLAVSLYKKVVAIFLIKNSLIVISHEYFKSFTFIKNKILNLKFFENNIKLVVLIQE